MSLMEVTVSILIMAVGVTASSAAWTSAVSEIEFANDLHRANLCADNAVEVLVADKSMSLGSTPLKTEEETTENDSSCKVQVAFDSMRGEIWEEVQARSGKATTRRWILSSF